MLTSQLGELKNTQLSRHSEECSALLSVKTLRSDWIELCVCVCVCD